MKSSKQIFDFFPGIWKLTRSTSSSLKSWPGYATGECIRAEGYAVFAPSELDKNLLVYSEKVTVYNLNVNNAKGGEGIEARQRYHYRYNDETAVLSKYFTDGRLFYDVNIVGDNGESTVRPDGDTKANKICGAHLCMQDNYVSDYKLGVGTDGQPQFTLVYSVNGPKKCYDIRTDYRKLEPSDIDALGIRIENGEIL